MSDALNSLIETIVGKLFGNIAEVIVSCLSKRDSLTFSEIVTYCKGRQKIKIDLIKKTLAALLHHNLIRAFHGERKAIIYVLNYKTCYSCLRWSRFTCLVNQSFGETAEMLVEELLMAGRASTSEIVMKTAERMKESQEFGEEDSDQSTVDINRIAGVMERLIETNHILERAPPHFIEPEEDSEEMKNLMKVRFFVPSNFDVIIRGLRKKWAQQLRNEEAGEEEEEEREPPSKRLRVDEETEVGREEPMFRVNISELEALWRDEIIVNHAELRTETSCSSFMRYFLSRCRVIKPTYASEWGATSVQLAEVELRRNLPTDLASLPSSHIDQCIRLLCEDSGTFLMKVEQVGGGGILVCPFERTWGEIVMEVVESAVQERLGAHAKRAFRLIFAENYASLPFIEEKTMLNSVLSRQFVYRLQDQNFIKKVELSKSNDFSTTATMSLYHVELPAVVRMLLQWCYQTMHRLMVSRDNQLVSNKRLFDKQLRVDALVSSMDEQISALEDNVDDETQDLLQQLQEQREEIPKAITPSEKLQLTRAHSAVQKLSLAEVELDEQIFILDRYIFSLLPVVVQVEK